MARRPRVFAPGLLYHVIVRGNQTFRTDVLQPEGGTVQRLARRHAQVIPATPTSATTLPVTSTEAIPLHGDRSELYAEAFMLREKESLWTSR